MPSARVWIIGVGILIVLLGGIVIPPRPFLIRDIGRVFSIQGLIQENQELQERIINLEAELYSLQASYVIPSSEEYIPAKVFSFYPLNTRAIMYITAGTREGIQEGDGVVFNESVLVGQIIKTEAGSSAVRTIFDSDFSLPVRIGVNEVEGLLEGGASPRVALIDKTKTIASGDTIISATKEFPYGLMIGTVSMVREDASGAFLEAGIEPPYVLSDVRNVSVIQSY